MDGIGIHRTGPPRQATEGSPRHRIRGSGVAMPHRRLKFRRGDGWPTVFVAVASPASSGSLLPSHTDFAGARSSASHQAITV
jgi:hypothetical protein